jgi:hypothetical protein
MEVQMACNLKACTFHIVKIDPKILPGAQAPPGGVAEIGAVTVTKDQETAGPVIDNSAQNAADSLLQKFKKDMNDAQETECGKGCICIKQEGAVATGTATFEVPVSAVYHNAAAGKFMRADGTVRATITDFPGKCFTDYGLRTALFAVEQIEDEFKPAVMALRDEAKEYVTYFLPEGEKHFDPVSVALGFGSVLLISFLAGFQEEAKKDAKGAGKKTFRWLSSLVSDLFSGRSSKESEEAKKLATSAKKTKKSLKEADVRTALDRAEQGLASDLAPKIGKRKAALLAKKVRDVADREILK